MADGYRVEPLDLGAEALETVSAFLRRTFPKARHLTARYLAWQYGQNPDGPALGCNILAGATLASHVGAVPLRARIDGELRRGVMLVNGATHAEHRRRGLSIRLMDSIFEQAAGLGYDFSLATGNWSSTAPMLIRQAMVRQIDARVGFGRPRRSRPLPEPSFERIWSDEALRWRLGDPERRYGVRPSGDGIRVTASAGMPGIAAILYQGPGDARLATPVPAGGPLRLWLGLDPRIDWRGSPFAPIPQRLRPSPLNLTYRDLTGGGFVPDPDRLIFQALDFDAY
ncbi:MAG TPA: GNAT family N-acetyltransferase [Allosphingosinicella sp.]